MARSYGALKTSVWEPGSDLRELEPLPQWAYMMLISQPQISNLGVLAYTPEKWCRFAFGLTAAALERAIGELEEQGFVIVDRDAGELLVRTFIKHDKVWSQPKLVTNARRLIREVESEQIRNVLVRRHPWLIDERSTKDEIAAFEESAETPSDRGIERASDTPISPRAGAGPGSGLGSAADGEDQNPDLSTELHHAALNVEEPAAAEPLEAARLSEIRSAVEQLADHDHGTLAQVEQLAQTVPASVFRDVVARVALRCANGNVGNHTGLFVDLLRRASRDFARSLIDASARVQRTPLEDVLVDARMYAQRGHPWDAVEFLIVRKLTRFGVHGDDQASMVAQAAGAYRDRAVAA